MPVSKLKNLAILILLLANIALLALLIPRHLEQSRQEDNLRNSLTQLCAQQDVVLNPTCVPDTIKLYPLELAEREQAESAALTVLLGEMPAVVNGQLQTSSKAQPLRIGSWENGALTLRLSGQEEVSDFLDATEDTLEQMGFQVYRLAHPDRLSPGIYAVTATQSVLGVPVFSQGLTMTYSNSCLTDVNGQFFAGTLTQSGSSACMSAADAVVAFLSCRVDLGWVGSSITRMQQGYLRTDAAGTLVHLTPVWRLSTDTGDFYVNGLTAEVTSID